MNCASVIFKNNLRHHLLLMVLRINDLCTEPCCDISPTYCCFEMYAAIAFLKLLMSKNLTSAKKWLVLTFINVDSNYSQITTNLCDFYYFCYLWRCTMYCKNCDYAFFKNIYRVKNAQTRYFKLLKKHYYCTKLLFPVQHMLQLYSYCLSLLEIAKILLTINLDTR